MVNGASRQTSSYTKIFKRGEIVQNFTLDEKMENVENPKEFAVKAFNFQIPKTQTTEENLRTQWSREYFCLILTPNQILREVRKMRSNLLNYVLIHYFKIIPASYRRLFSLVLHNFRNLLI